VAVGEYVNAGDVRTYYEVYGEGEPVVLLHGELATAESWAMQVPALAEGYRSSALLFSLVLQVKRGDENKGRSSRLLY
jgi:pimeloyl-ACP methyl ester carboxylesterase